MSRAPAASNPTRQASSSRVPSSTESTHTDMQNGQRLAAMDDVKRIMKEEVRTDWIDLWEERWRKRLEHLQSKSKSLQRREGSAGATRAETDTDRDVGGESADDGDDEDDDDDGGWDGAGEGWDGDRKDREEIWVPRGDDSDFLKAADAYTAPVSLPSTPGRSPPPIRRNVPGSPGRSEGWTASVSRLMEGIGFGFSASPPKQSELPPSNAGSIYPSSSTTPFPTATTTPATMSANPSAPGSPPTAGTVASPYRFASPDSISPSLAALREKRKEELDRQMDLNDPEWNVGLKCWTERRDAWTGADKEGRVRVGRSKFAENPLTASINEAAYSAIYNKCIKKALPPVVPINLRHITNAMVAGWKKDNEWPPAPTAPEPSFSRRRHNKPLGRNGVGSAAPPTDGGGGGRRVLGML